MENSSSSLGLTTRAIYTERSRSQSQKLLDFTHPIQPVDEYHVTDVMACIEKPVTFSSPGNWRGIPARKY
jgi:hypothetical protein